MEAFVFITIEDSGSPNETIIIPKISEDKYTSSVFINNNIKRD